MTTLNSLSSSGQFINIDALVQNAVRVQQQRVGTLQTQKNNMDSQISTLGKAKSLISTLEEKFKALGTVMNNYNVKGAPETATVTATQSGTYSVSVNNLSAPQIISTKNAIGSGALGYSGKIILNKGSYDELNNFEVKTPGTPIDIVATDTLTSIAKKINDSNSGVYATIINGDDGQHLSFSGNFGSENAFQIDTQDNAATGISFFNYSQANTNNFNNIAQAKDGKATINGITISSADNDFKTSEGFSIKATKEFASQTITVEKDDSAVIKAMDEFVTAYNSATTSLKDMDIDHQFQNLTSKLRSILGEGDYTKSVSQIGLNFDKHGVLSFDKTKYAKFNTTNSGNNTLSTLLNEKFGTQSKGLEFLKNSIKDDGMIDNKITFLTEQSKRMVNTIDANKDLLSTQMKSYQVQFAKLDQYISQLNNNSNTVNQLGLQLTTKA